MIWSGSAGATATRQFFLATYGNDRGFDLPEIGRSPARFDFAKLENLNGHYIRTSSDDELMAAIEELLPYFANAPRPEAS